MTAAIGRRVREIRTRRGLTLGDVASATGISRSTLSRLENDQRRPTLELLLALATTYRVSLDDLVGAPETGDPRLRPRPRRLKGRAVVPLTESPGGVQAWKIVIPAALSHPQPRSHGGRELLYVLSGRLRLVLGDQELVLSAGETADFDTAVPHWFGSTGADDVEVLSLYGRPGDHRHLQPAVTRRHPPGSRAPAGRARGHERCPRG